MFPNFVYFFYMIYVQRKYQYYKQRKIGKRRNYLMIIFKEDLEKQWKQ